MLLNHVLRLGFKNILMDSSENVLFPLPDPYGKSLAELEFRMEKRSLKAAYKCSFADDVHQSFCVLTKKGVHVAYNINTC